MATVVKVELGPRSYEIRIGPGLLDELGRLCRDAQLGPVCLVVSDSHVDLQYGERAERRLADAGFVVHRVVVPAGETSKSPERLLALYGRAVKAGLGRDGFAVALGGGVVGDLAGFFAATYLRGIPFVQVPTSLMAMVDSSVGGKTGINLTAGKNLVGAFHQPAVVLIDVDTLKSLPRREFVSGLAEVVKYGIIRDAALFEKLEREAEQAAKYEWKDWPDTIATCCRIKADVVSQDERESGLRAILNFGHTLGHALEQVTGYSRWLHGEAVAIGMVFAARLSSRVLGAPRDEMDRIERLLARLGLPVRPERCGWNDVRHAMAADKKTRAAQLRFVLARRIGEVVHGCEVGEEALRETWAEWGP
jgi:3-dehydroquinate synthase